MTVPESGRRGDPATGDWLRPRWSAPRVSALMTTRLGGCSAAPFDSLNLRHGIGDDAPAVDANLRTLRAQMDAEPVWLEQVHGRRVVQLGPDDVAATLPQRADASVCAVPGIACMVQVADCLPVLMSAGGRSVGAAHAGWRGLAAGVLQATVDALCDLACCRPDAVEAWLGPCIGPRRFEVGADVLQAFAADPRDLDHPRFRPRGAGLPGKWLADLPGLAEDVLRAAGVQRISVAGLCTVEQRSRFFSYRRDGVTGRMAAGIWLGG